MATAAYIAAAQQSNRQPTVLVNIEAGGSIETSYSSVGDWFGSSLKNNIDAIEVFGSAIMEAKSYYVGTLGGNTTTVNGGILLPAFPNPTGYNTKTQCQVWWEASQGDTVAVDLELWTGDRATLQDTSYTQTVSRTSTVTNGYVTYYTGYADFFFTEGTSIINGAVYSVFATGVNGSTVIGCHTLWTEIPRGGSVTTYTVQAAAQLVTSVIDLGSIPASSPTLNITDLSESSRTSVTYTAAGGNSSPPTNPLGPVIDGSVLDAYQYYTISAEFVTSTGERSRIDEFSFTVGDTLAYGTHADTPSAGVKPYIVNGSLTPISQKIKLDKGISSTGQVTVKLQWTKEVADTLSTGYMKGKDVAILSGWVGLSVDDYNKELTGTWYDHTYDSVSNTITVTVQDVLKQFEKRKLPIASFNAGTGVETTTPLPYSNDNIVDTIINIYDLLGIRGRYISTAEYTALSSGSLSGTGWDVTRTLTKPIAAWKLLDELAQTAGLFLVPQGDGTISPIQYDAAATPVDEINVNFGKVSIIKGNNDAFYTRSYAYYNIASGVTEPTEDVDDYDNGYAQINTVAENLYDPEQGQKEWFDKWSIGYIAAPLASPPTALINLTERWQDWFSEPRASVDISNLPPRFANATVGSVVGLTNLIVVVPSASWDSGVVYNVGDKIVYSGRVYRAKQVGTNQQPDTATTYWDDENIVTQAGDYLGRGITDNKPHLVTARTYDPNKATIKLSLLELP